VRHVYCEGEHNPVTETAGLRKLFNVRVEDAVSGLRVLRRRIISYARLQVNVLSAL
jgi:hypothetical protein